MYQAYVNGQMVDADSATVPMADAGFQHGVGLFETFQVYGGGPFLLDRHLERLRSSATELGLAAELDVEALRAAVEHTLDHATGDGRRVQRCRVRLTLTAGTLRMRPGAAGEAESAEVRQTVVVHPQPPTAYDPAYFERGVAVTIQGPAANPFDVTAGHKTLNYWPRLRALRQAAAAGASESVWLSVTNHLACGCVSNVFVVRGGVLLTPIARGEEPAGGLPAPVLPGVTRGWLIEQAEASGVAVRREMLTVEDLLDADEVLLTNSGWGVLPVRQVERKVIGDGAVGPLTRGWVEAYAAAVGGA